MTIGQTLRDIREKKKWSLRRVAGMADISPAAVSHAELDRHHVTLDTLQKIVRDGLGFKRMSQFFAIVERNERKAAA